MSVLRVLLGVILLCGTAWASLIDVTTCGQTIPPGGKGILQTDLVCPTDLGAINLGAGAKLLLNGYTITGGRSGIVGSGGGRYSVRGPGAVTGSADYCIIVPGGGTPRGHLRVRDLTLGNCGLGGAGADRVDLRGVTIADIAYTSEGFGNGVVGSDVRVRGSAIARTVVGIRAYALAKVYDTTVQDGTVGIRVDSGKLLGVRVTVTDNTSWGIRVGTPNETTSTLVLRSSTVTGNLYDLASPTLPQLTLTTCGTSAQPQIGGNFGPSWGVCQDD